MKRTTQAALATALFLGLAGSSCVDNRIGDTVEVFPVTMKFSSVEDLENRLSYEITGPDWEAEHVEIGDAVWFAGVDPRVDNGLLKPEMNEPAPYLRGTPMKIEATLGMRGIHTDETASIRVEATGRLHSTTDHTIEPIDMFEWQQELPMEEAVRLNETSEEIRFEPHIWTTATLPERVDLYRLEISWELTPLNERAEPIETAWVRSEHKIPTAWRRPLPEAPLYKEVALWSAKWAAGEWKDGEIDAPDTVETEYAIASALNRGLRDLSNHGYSYGAFPRPPKDQIGDRADVFLDFKRSACGEFRGILMALIEFHGIDAFWIWFRFPPREDGDQENFARYKTREIAAVGRETKNWFDTNHIIVGVRDRVYDPTYTVEKDSWQEYEDWMFLRYCKGKTREDESNCIDNPEGLDEETLGLDVIIADNYK